MRRNHVPVDDDLFGIRIWVGAHTSTGVEVQEADGPRLLGRRRRGDGEHGKLRGNRFARGGPQHASVNGQHGRCRLRVCV